MKALGSNRCSPENFSLAGVGKIFFIRSNLIEAKWDSRDEESNNGFTPPSQLSQLYLQNDCFRSSSNAPCGSRAINITWRLLFDEPIDEHQHKIFLSFMAFNVHLLSERRAFPADSFRVLTMLSSCLMNCENGISADFLLYFLIAFFRFEAFSAFTRLFREFSCALHPFNLITSRHDLEREIITLTDGEKACRR